MIRYRLVTRDAENKTLEIRSGEVGEVGKINIVATRGYPPIRTIEITWEVCSGNHSDNELRVNQT